MMNMRLRTAEGNFYNKYRFRQCERYDFESRGVVVDESFGKTIDGRLCPDIPITEEFN